ncbi:hypothetical protein DVV97_17075 [Clostridium botulinum]|nr:hypothetical protein [Clostridium botulinum]
MKTNLLLYIKLTFTIYAISILALLYVDIISFKSFDKLIFPVIIFSFYCIIEKTIFKKNR